jgi:hypothetical protein
MHLATQSIFALAIFALVGVVLLFVQPVTASDLTVKVNQTGKPVSGASVCVGSSQEPTLFGSYETDSNGIARFNNLPNGSLTVTAVKAGKGRQTVRTNHVVGWVFIDLSTPVGNLSCQRR